MSIVDTLIATHIPGDLGHTADHNLIVAIVKQIEVGSDNWLRAHANDVAIDSAQYNSNGALVTATVIWPNGATGQYSADNLSSQFLGAVDGYHMTYVTTSITKTVTQPLITRDSNGNIISQPLLVIT